MFLYHQFNLRFPLSLRTNSDFFTYIKFTKSICNIFATNHHESPDTNIIEYHELFRNYFEQKWIESRVSERRTLEIAILIGPNNL